MFNLNKCYFVWCAGCFFALCRRKQRRAGSDNTGGSRDKQAWDFLGTKQKTNENYTDIVRKLMIYGVYQIRYTCYTV